MMVIAKVSGILGASFHHGALNLITLRLYTREIGQQHYVKIPPSAWHGGTRL